jgi:hypothetical protein
MPLGGVERPPGAQREIGGAVSVNRFGFPHAAQVIQVTRKTRDLHTNR